MELEAKKQKIIFIIAAAVFLLMALTIAGLLMDRGRAAASPTPSPTIAPTDTPAPEGVTIGGKFTAAGAESFDLTGKMLSPEDMAAIASLKKLQALSLSNCGLSDLGFLSRMTGLRTLYLPGNAIRDLTPLSSLTELRTLYLDKNPLEDLTPLTGLTGLQTLSLQGVNVTDYALEDLRAAMPGCRIFCDSAVDAPRPITLGGAEFTEEAQELDLSNQGLSDISPLGYCTHLRVLNLAGNPVEDLSVLYTLHELISLNLSATGLTDADLEGLKTLRRLTYLNVDGNEALSPEALEALDTAMGDCQVVHKVIVSTLELGGVTLRSDDTAVDLRGRGLTGIQGLEKFGNLQTLLLDDNAVTDLSPLRELGALTELTLGGNGLSDLSPLAGHRTLRRLDLSRNAISNLSALSGLVWLEELDLRENPVGEVSVLATCVRLRELKLSGCPLGPEQIRALQESLPGCHIETDVDLSMPEPTPEAPPEPEAPAEPESPGEPTE